MVAESLVPRRKSNKFISYLKNLFGKTKGEITFNIINYFIFVLLFIACLFPFLYVLVKSLKVVDISGETAITKFGIDAYIEVLKDDDLFGSFMLSILVTVVATILSLIITTLGSYPLIRKDLKDKGYFERNSAGICCYSEFWH